MQAPLRVAVISPHELVRAGLVDLLSRDRHRTNAVPYAGEDVAPEDHDVAVVDLGRRPPHAPDLRRLVTATGTPVVALIARPNPEMGDRLQQLGVHHVVTMDVTAESLLSCVEDASRVRARSATWREESRDGAHRVAGLTPRELDVLERVAAGRSNVEIAAELFISINTVKTNIRTAYKRIGATTRSQAVLWAVQNELGP
jgi:DNA-binding NarL/FixJ family response regulator